MENLRKKIAIDLGTASVLVYAKGKGVVLSEPSVVAYNSYNGKIISVGKEAKKMLGRTPGNIIAKRPMKDGVIADFNATEKMIKYFIEKSVGNSLFRPILLICVPSQITEIQRRAVIQASRYAGAHQTYLIEEPLAAAIGAGLDISEAEGNMVVDIGGGTTDVAVISSGGLVINRSSPVAGDELDEAITEYVKRKYNMMIGERTAENIKINIASVYPRETDDLFEVRGRNIINGLPMHVYITSADIHQAIKRPIQQILNTIQDALESTPAELAADLYQQGIVLTGGGALINGLDQRIKEETGLEVSVADGPVTCVVRGTGKALNRLEDFNSEEFRELTRQKNIEERIRIFN